MKIQPGIAWGVITARGGSKTIKLKNLLPVAGQPLVHYCAKAALAASTVSHVVCSTEHDGIAAAVESLGVEVLRRPDHLCGDDVNSIDVMLDVVRAIEERAGVVPEILVLLQPTSLFMTSAQIDAAVNALRQHPNAKSSQTVVKVPHQFHAHNQRHMSPAGDDVWFVFEKERAKGHNKQAKPVYYAYGNLIVTRTEALMADRTVFARPSIPVMIDRYSAYDLDGPDDLELAELLIERSLVKLP